MDLLIFSVVVLLVTGWLAYTWGKEGRSFDGKGFTFMLFAGGIILVMFAGYGFGKGHPAKAPDILKKGLVYSVESSVNKNEKVYATVTDEYGSVYAPVFDKPPPPKFKVVEDKNGQVYIAVP